MNVKQEQEEYKKRKNVKNNTHVHQNGSQKIVFQIFECVYR